MIDQGLRSRSQHGVGSFIHIREAFCYVADKMSSFIGFMTELNALYENNLNQTILLRCQQSRFTCENHRGQ